MGVSKARKAPLEPSPAVLDSGASEARDTGKLSLDARRVLRLFRERSCHVVGRGLLWQVIATAAFAQRFDKDAGIAELTRAGLVALSRGHRYVITLAGESYLRAMA